MTSKKSLSQKNFVHASMIAKDGRGILISGHSGVGKSTLALEMIQNGYQLVSDDIVMLHQKSGCLIGSSPPPLNGILYCRPLGYLNIVECFGKKSLCSEAKILGIVELLARPKSHRYNKNDSALSMLRANLPKLVLEMSSASNKHTLIDGVFRRWTRQKRDPEKIITERLKKQARIK